MRRRKKGKHQLDTGQKVSSSSEQAGNIAGRLSTFFQRLIVAPFFVLARGCTWFIRVLANSSYRFYWDDCFSRAASLSYTTLFALVPGVYIMMNMLHVFGVSEDQIGLTIDKILSGMLPPTNTELLHDLKVQVFSYLDRFRSNVQALKTFSILLLSFSSISLINTIESAFNVVWRVTTEKSILGKVSVFWTLLTLGSVLLYLSFYSSAQIHQIFASQIVTGQSYFPYASLIVPIIVMSLVLTLMFYSLPSARVQLQDAALGGVIAAVLFEGVKWGFAFFMGYSSTYSTIYGVLAAVPLFMFWMYLAWCVVLFGAEVAYQAGSIHILLGLRKYSTELGEVGVLLGMRVLQCIGTSYVQGNSPPSEGEVAMETGTDPVLLRNCLDALTEAGLLTPPDPKAHRRTLIMAPEKLTVQQIIASFHSKEYRVRLAHRQRKTGYLNIDPEQITLLEVVRSASIKLGDRRDLASWTLRDLIDAAPRS